MVEQHSICPTSALFENQGSGSNGPFFGSEKGISRGRHLQNRTDTPDEFSRLRRREKARKQYVTHTRGRFPSGHQRRLPNVWHDQSRNEIPFVVDRKRHDGLEVQQKPCILFCS